MAHHNVYTVNPGWRILLMDAGWNPTNVLRRAGLPDDLFGRERETLTTEEFFGLWRAIEDEADDPTVSLRIGSSISMEAFDPPIFGNGSASSTRPPPLRIEFAAPCSSSCPEAAPRSER